MTVVADSAALARTTFRRIQRHQSPAVALAGKFAGQNAVETQANRAEVVLSDGRRVLDFGSYAVTLLGHRHPDVVAAVSDQLRAMPVSTRSLANPVAALAAEALVGYLDGKLPRVYFGTNGSDAVEVALKLARIATGRHKVIGVRGAFHGKTMGALAVTHELRFRAGLEGLLTSAEHVDASDHDAVDRIASRGDVAAVIFEPVQGENGVTPLPREVLARWCADAHRHGAMVISDEIQVGMRRAGHPSIAMHDGLDVDAVLLGKPLGGGVVPISAALCSDALYAPLVKDPFLHSTTFGAQPLCAAAVPAALIAIEGLADRGEEISRLVSTGLAELMSAHPDVVAGVRGQGMIWGVDFSGPALSGEVQIALARRGLLVSPCLSRPQTLRLLPPLVATDAEVQRALEILGDAVADARRTFPSEAVGVAP